MSPARAALVELLELERYAPPPPPLDELELERRERRRELLLAVERRQAVAR